MKLGLFFILLCQATPSFGGEVIPFERKRKSCSALLSPGSPQAAEEKSLSEAKVLTFSSRDPGYETADKFIGLFKKQESQGTARYLYSTDPPVFHYNSQSLWTTLPNLGLEDYLYILTVELFDPEFSKLLARYKKWTAKELRSYVRLQSFTRVRISPFFQVIGRAIREIRGIESKHRPSPLDTLHPLPETSLTHSSLRASLLIKSL